MLLRRRKRRIEIEQSTLRVEPFAGSPPAPMKESSLAGVVMPAGRPALSGSADERESKDLEPGTVV